MKKCVVVFTVACE